MSARPRAVRFEARGLVSRASARSAESASSDGGSVAVMSDVGPLQIVVVGFETTDRFRGDIARELGALRGRGVIRVLDARLFHRSPEGRLTEVDLGPVLDAEQDTAIAHLLGANGARGNGGRRSTSEALAHTAGFALEDLRRLTDEIGPGDHAAVLLVEHVWASRLRETVREAGGRLLGQGFLTPEVVMIVGAELQARADAEAAIELAEAARGSALVEALERFGAGTGSAEDRSRGAVQVVRTLVDQGFLDQHEAPGAIDALVTAGMIESAVLQAAIAEAEDLVDEA
jgi:hypothetical protein